MARLKLNKPAGEALRALARQDLARTIEELDEAARGAKVHGARKRLKSDRSLLRLVHHSIGKEAFETADCLLRDAAMLLASARHSEAMQEAITKLDAGPARAALQAKAGALLADTHENGDKAVRAAEAASLVREARKCAADWSLPKSELQPYIEGMRASYARAKKGLAAGLGAGDIAVLHNSRKSVIHHLHHLEVLERIWPRMFKLWTGELTGLREALGDLHDLEELEKSFGKDGGLENPELASIAARAMAVRRDVLFKEVKLKAGLLYAEKPRAFAARMGAMWRHCAD